MAVHLCGVQNANADMRGREEGTFQFLQQSARSPVEGVKLQSKYPGFDYDVLWQIENLDGQAVSLAQIMWWFPEGVRLPLPQPPGGRVSISHIPRSSWSRINLYDLKFQMIIHRKDQEGKGQEGKGPKSKGQEKRYSLIFDLGIPHKPDEKKWSINVKTHQAWDRLITRYQGPGGENGIYISAEEARDLVGQGGQNTRNMIVVENSWLLEPRMSIVDFNEKLLATRIDWQANLMVRTIRSQLINLEKTTRLPTEKLELRLVKLTSLIDRNMVEIPEDLQRLFDKLNSGVPEQYIVPSRREFYHAQRIKIREKAKREAFLLQPGHQIDEYPLWFDRKVRALELE